MFERARLYLSKGLDPTLVNMRLNVAKTIMRLFFTVAFKIGVFAARIAGPGNQAELARHNLGLMPSAEAIRSVGARNGLAREVDDWEQRMAACAQEIRPDSQWTFHKDTWGPHEVVVLPQITDSNTGIVVGPKDNPDRGAVITNDGGPPNCDPPALYQMLHGPCPPRGPIDAEFVDEPAKVGSIPAPTNTPARSNTKQETPHEH